jgi:hypothetical protein
VFSRGDGGDAMFLIERGEIRIELVNQGGRHAQAA